MITIVTQTFNSVAVIIQWVLQLASFVGQLIVILLTNSLNVIFNTIRNIFNFFQIVYEDNVFIFTEELPLWTTQYLDTMLNQYLYLQNLLWLLYTEVQYLLMSMITSVKSITNTSLFIVIETLILLKNFLLILGEALWFILTFLPVHLPYLIKTLSKHVKDVVITYIYETYKVLLRFTNFLSDVPLESFIGIMSAIALVRFYVTFRIEIHSRLSNLYWVIVRRLWYLYHTIYNYFTNSDVRIITRVASGEAIISRDVNLDEDIEDIEDVNAADALCVICQERQKCVLILPCKHVCLCRECCLQLYGYQRTCPICRTFIYHSVTIYL